MFAFLLNRGTLYRLPAELNDLADEHAMVRAEMVPVTVRLRGKVPGVSAASSAARYKGAFALTDTRVFATLPTGADPRLRALDCSWDLPHGPGRVSISAEGMTIEITLPAVDAAFSGSMSLTYKRAIAPETLQQLPSKELWCAVDPILVYRAVGVRPRSGDH